MNFGQKNSLFDGLTSKGRKLTNENNFNEPNLSAVIINPFCSMQLKILKIRGRTMQRRKRASNFSKKLNNRLRPDGFLYF